MLAYNELFDSPRADSTRHPVVVLLSDGKPEPLRYETLKDKAAYASQLRALVERFREQNCPIFTVALASAATDADPDIQTVYRNLWQEMAARTPPAEYHEARTAPDLLRIYHDIVARLSGIEAQAPVVDADVANKISYRVPVEANLAHMTLIVLKTAPAIQVRVLRPEGLVLHPDDPDTRYTGEAGTGRQEIWTVTTPRSGDWAIELSGQGHVIAWMDAAPLPPTQAKPAYYALELASPPSYVSDGAPLPISARMSPTVRNVVMTADLHRAGFSEAMLLLHDDGAHGDERAADGVFTALHADPAPGVYTVYLRALRDGEELAHWEGAFEVVALPRLKPLPPAEDHVLHPGQAISACTQVVAGHATLDQTALSFLGVLTATLIGPAQDIQPLTPAFSEDRFCVAGAAPSAGSCDIVFDLAGRTVEGLPFTDTARLALRVLPLPTPTALPAPVTPTGAPVAAASVPPPRPDRRSWLLGGGLIGMVGLAGAGCWAIWQRTPHLEGQLNVAAAPGGRPTGYALDLSSCRGKVRVGGRSLPLAGDRLRTLAPFTLYPGRDDPGLFSST